MNKQLFALCGLAGSGKSTAAKIIQEMILESVIVSFAKPLKDICHIAYGWAGIQRAEYYEQNPKHKNVVNRVLKVTPRQLWIAMGTDFCRNRVHPDTWPNALFHLYGDHPCLIIPDCRFKNEAETVRKRGGKLIWIERDVPDVVDVNQLTPEMCDVVVENGGTVDELSSKIKEILL